MQATKNQWRASWIEGIAKAKQEGTRNVKKPPRLDGTALAWETTVRDDIRWEGWMQVT